MLLGFIFFTGILCLWFFTSAVSSVSIPFVTLLSWWFTCFACFYREWFTVVQHLPKSKHSCIHLNCASSKGLLHKGWMTWMVLILMFRVGEAANPGPFPAGQETWSFGLFNPSGLTSKTDQVAHLPGQVWVAAETHLTKHGVDKFKQGIRSLGSPYRFVVPGSPCQPRSATDVGNFSGVLLMSELPARPVAHDFPANLFETGRLQVSGVCLGSSWVQIGMMYGVPAGSKHAQPLYQTECLLEALVDRVACQIIGPRIICGDFNFEPHELEQCQRLLRLGFREIQDVASQRFGHRQIPTSRGGRRLDQIWLSPELQECLRSICIEDHWWPDHAVVSGSFSRIGPAYTFDHWVMPKPFPWPADMSSCRVSFDGTIDPSIAYASMWHQLESEASHILQSTGTNIQPVQCGRGLTLSTTPRRYCLSPCKIGREGDDHPAFTGLSLQHCRWFRQLRRLQALSRSLFKAGYSHHQIEQRANLWVAVKNAKGFGGGFAWWWTCQKLAPQFPSGFPYLVPSAEEVQTMFLSFRQELKNFEHSLMHSRVQKAKLKRKHNLQHVFQDCQRDRPSLVDALVSSHQGTVAEVRADDSSIVFDEPFQYRPSLPLVCEGQILEVIHAEEDQIWVGDISNLEAGAVVRQEQAIVTDRAILQEFERVWSARWQKFEHLDPAYWTKIVEFIRQVMPPMQWDFADWSPEVLKGLINSKKRRSAVGSDGVSRHDLQQLPPKGLQAICDMFQSIEKKHQWPSQLTVGFVSSLDKGRGANSVDAFRPITIYPLLYRVWSSKRAREALHSSNDALPDCIRGGVPFKQAKPVWFEVSQLVEASHWEGSSLQGLVLDIRRAFNALPRVPLWEMLAAMHFPPDLIATWAAFTASQTRRFKVRRSVGSPVSSCVGLPEGCGLSVFGMVLFDWAFQLFLEVNCALPKKIYVYVDDWQVVFYDPLHLEAILECVRQFTENLDLEIDFNKSFTWSAHTGDRSFLQDSEVPVMLAARDLGAHQNFSKRMGNCVLTTRIKSMSPTWKQLARSFAPYKSKLFALLQLAWTRSLYAVSITWLGQQHFQGLRTGASRGLKIARVGANPCLHLSTNGGLHDPECWAIIATVREAREVGDCDQLRQMLSFLGSGQVIPSNGPTAVLAKRLCRLGWVVNTQGYFCDDIGPFDPLSVSWDELMLRVRRSWPATMAALVAHRRSFEGLASADVDEVLRALRTYGESDQVYLRCALDGTLYTDTHKDKHQRGRESKCQFCGAIDGFRHCLWECPEFASQRSDFRWYKILPDLPSCFVCHGWVIQPPSWGSLLKEFQAIPPPYVMQAPADTDLHYVDLFTDGTCLFPKEPKLRFAGWAVTWASSGTNSLDHSVLSAGHVSGIHQTSYRAELVALSVALQIAVRSGKKTRIWCDCQAVVNRCRWLQAGGKLKLNDPHSDLWSTVLDRLFSVSPGTVRIGKVMSHGSHRAAQSELETWVFWHSQLVDAAAADFNVKRPTSFWLQWSQVVRELHLLRMIHADIFQLIIRIGHKKRGRTAIASTQPYEQTEFEQSGDPGGPDTASGIGQTPIQWRYTAQLVRQCLRGNLDPILKWWTHVGIVGFNKFRLVWISGLQLYVDFCYAMNNPGPVMVRGKWLDPGVVGFREHSLTVARRVKCFVTMWKAFLKANQLRIPIKLLRPHSSAIAYWCQCYRLPWNPKRMRAIDEVILGLHKRQVVRPENLGSVSLFPIPEGNPLHLHSEV